MEGVSAETKSSKIQIEQPGSGAKLCVKWNLGMLRDSSPKTYRKRYSNIQVAKPSPIHKSLILVGECQLLSSKIIRLITTKLISSFICFFSAEQLIFE